MVDLRDIFEDSPRRRRRLAAMVVLAIVGDFFLNTLLEPESRGIGLRARIVSFVAGSLFLVLFGIYLGRRAWPRRGLALSRSLLRRRVARKNAGIIVLTDRPDQTFSMTKRLLEVVGFAAGATVIVTVVLAILGLELNVTFASASILVIVSLWASFLLVPYWVFSHLGLRQVDPVRWLVHPVGRRYGERLRLSNGVLLLLGFGAVVQLAFRAGASGDVALIQGVSIVGHVVASVLVASAIALALYVHDEHALVRALEADALEMGILDARGMTDGEFLPKVPEKRQRDLFAKL